MGTPTRDQLAKLAKSAKLARSPDPTCPIPLFATVSAVYRPRRFAIVPSFMIAMIGVRLTWLAVERYDGPWAVPAGVGHDGKGKPPAPSPAMAFLLLIGTDGAMAPGGAILPSGDSAGWDDLADVRIIRRPGPPPAS